MKKTLSKKIVLLGHFGVGKSSLIKRFVHRVFSDEYLTTIGVHIQKKVVDLGNNVEMSLIIWDLEGTTSISKTRDTYLLGSKGLIYVFDCTRQSTYINIDQEMALLKQKFPKVKVKIVGNKSDLLENGSPEELLNSLTTKCDYITSAKTGDHVDEMFLALANELKDD